LEEQDEPEPQQLFFFAWTAGSLFSSFGTAPSRTYVAGSNIKREWESGREGEREREREKSFKTKIERKKEDDKNNS